VNTVLVTGGAGFIGSAVLRQLLRDTDHVVVNVDKLTYAGHRASLADVDASPRHVFVHADIADADRMRAIFAEHRPGAVLHLAAESHVDRSIDGPADFIHTNVQGTFVLLQEARRHWCTLPAGERERFHFVHVSTDEVFGSLSDDGVFDERSRYMPNSPYSASKAASDHLARAWNATFGLPVTVTNSSNNYGPYQFPEKLIPLLIQRARTGQTLPVYGRGEHVRDWLHVEDHARGLLGVLDRGSPGATYLFGSRTERRNIDVVRAICALLDELSPAANGTPHASRIEFVDDRPGHDYRYAVDPSRAERDLAWRATTPFDAGLRATVEWYLANQAWCDTVQQARPGGGYDGERLGRGERR
jgi:dTDP-glucose 4,6-dehydratase